MLVVFRVNFVAMCWAQNYFIESAARHWSNIQYTNILSVSIQFAYLNAWNYIIPQLTYSSYQQNYLYGRSHWVAHSISEWAHVVRRLGSHIYPFCRYFDKQTMHFICISDENIIHCDARPFDIRTNSEREWVSEFSYPHVAHQSHRSKFKHGNVFDLSDKSCSYVSYFFRIIFIVYRVTYPEFARTPRRRDTQKAINATVTVCVCVWWSHAWTAIVGYASYRQGSGSLHRDRRYLSCFSSISLQSMWHRIATIPTYRSRLFIAHRAHPAVCENPEINSPTSGMNNFALMC